MKRWTRGLAVFLILLVAAACGPHAGADPDSVAAAGGDDPHVIMISFDGLMPAHLDDVETPAFDRVQRKGVRATSLLTVFPTKTFPNHYSIATGMYPGNHGLVDNSFWDPERGERYSMRDRETVEDGTWYGGEPIWVTAETQGMVAAAFFWVGTEADIQGVRPTFWRSYDGSVPNEERVDTVLEWLALPEEERPRLVTLYFSDVDSQAHRHGPHAPEVHEAVRHVDAMLGQLLDGLEGLEAGDDVHLVLVSDHGLTEGDEERAHALEEHVDLEGIRVDGWGPLIKLYFDGDTTRMEAVRDTLASALPRTSVLRRDEAPGRWHATESPRMGDLLVVPEQPWLAGTSRESLERVPGGHHGWDPAHDAMHGIFLAAGPSLREGVHVPALDAVHVYPLVAHILGLDPNPEIDGSLREVQAILR